MSIFCSETKPPSILMSIAPLRQAQLVGDHHLGIAAEHEFAEADQEIGQPERRHEQDDVGLVDQRPQHQPLDRHGEHEHHDDGERERHKGRDAVLVQADQRQRGEHHHDALREIEHAGGLEDQHEAERDQRIEHARDQPIPQRLHKQIRRRAHLHEGIDEDFVEKVHRRSLNAPRRDRRRSRPDCSSLRRACRRRS